MKIVALSKEEFDNFAYNHKYSTHYQTSTYAETARFEGLSTFYLGFVQDGKLIGATLFLYKKIYLHYKYAYAPRGLLIDYTNPNIVKNITLGIIDLLKKQHFAFVKIDPPIICSERDKNGNIIYFSNTINSILNILNTNGYRHQGFNKYFESYKPRFNAFVNLRADIKTIYSKVDKHTKDIIKKGDELGIELIQDTSANIDELYKFIVLKNKRRKKRYYQGLYDNFSKNNAVDIFFININVDNFITKTKQMFDNESIKNEELANLVQDQSITGSEKQKIINDKIESDKIVYEYKNNLIYATELSKKYPDSVTIGAGFTIKHNNGVELVIDSYLDEYVRFNPRYVFIWELIKKYKAEGYKYLNLNGVIGKFNTDDLGIYRELNSARLSFNSSIMEYAGEFDLIINEYVYEKFKKNIEKR